MLENTPLIYTFLIIHVINDDVITIHEHRFCCDSFYFYFSVFYDDFSLDCYFFCFFDYSYFSDLLFSLEFFFSYCSVTFLDDVYLSKLELLFDYC